MQGDPGESSRPLGKEKKNEPSAGSSKDGYPSIVVSRGRSEPRRAGRKKEDRIGGGGPSHDDGGGGESRNRRGRRWARKERERDRDRDDFGSRRSREFNRSEFLQNFIGLPEDSRISTILRKLAREDDERKFSNLIKLLQDALALPDNAAYIRRSLDMILDSLFELISTGPNQQCRSLAAKTLGNVGFALEKECKKFIDWMYDKYQSEADGNTRKLITVGIQELVDLDAEEKKLAEHVQTLMERVGQIMDTTECGDIFTTTVKLTLSLIHRYPELVSNHFQDTVDVLLGWHFEMSQPRSVTECAGRALTLLAPYWVQDLKFTYTLLNDFLEDIVSTKLLLFNPPESKDEKPSSKDVDVEDESGADQADKIASGVIPPQTRIQRITSILLVMSSVIKNLMKHFAPVIPPPVTADFLNLCLEKIIQNVSEILHFTPNLSSCMVGAGNKCVKLIVSVLGNDLQNVMGLMEFLYEQERLFDHQTMLKNEIYFSLIAKIIFHVDTAVTADYADLLLSPGSLVLKARLQAPGSKAFAIYKNLLSHKDIHVVLRSYALIVGDLDAALRSIKPDLPPLHEFGSDNPHMATVYAPDEIQPVIIFNLAALREFVNNRNPAILIPNLKPTLFEILAERMSQVIVPYKYPSVHLLYLSVLREHCIINNYFEEHVCMMESVASQTQSLAAALDLLSISAVPMVPKRNYYVSAIIYLLTQNMGQRMDDDNKILLVSWTHEILLRCQEKGESFEKSPELFNLMFTFFCASADYRPKIALACIPVLKLIAFNQPHLLVASQFDDETSFFSCTRGLIVLRLIDLCFYYLNSVDDKVRKEYHLLMSALPSAILTFVTRNHLFMSHCSIVQLVSNNYEDMVLYHGAIDSHVFREFMNYILDGTCFGKSFIWKMVEFMERSYKAYDEHGIEVKKSIGCIMEWMAFQAAKYCIENRFRTVYGKALGTFSAIEETIRTLANETASMKNLGDHPATAKRARLLVQFVEHLEKLYYNALEGTACAFQPVSSKTTKSFFQTNKGSCSEWFSRSRRCLLVIALYAGMSAWAVRHGYSLLQYLVDTKATQTAEFEATILNTGLALACMGERDAVLGLHQWARDISGSPHSELKPLIDMAARKYENAADKFEDMVADIGASTNVPKSKLNGLVDKPSCLPITVKTFVADQLTECYLALSSWDELSSWKKREVEFLANENGDSTRKYEYVTANFADAMSKFDSGDLSAASELLTWDDIQSGGDLFASERPKWLIANMMDETDFILKNIFVKKCCDPYYTLEALSSFGSAQTFAENVIEDILKDSSSEILSKACSLKYIAHAIINRGNSLITELYTNDDWWKMFVSSPDMERIAWWAVALEKLRKPQGPNESLKYYLLQVIKASRKAGNVRYTTKCLLNYLDQPAGGRVFHGDLAEECLNLPIEPATAPALHQLSKLLRSTCDTATSVRLSTHIAAGLFPLEEVDDRIVNSNVLRDLSKIFAAEKGHYDQLVSEQLKQIISMGIGKISDPNLTQFEDLCDNPRNSSVVPLPSEDTIVGKILLASVGAYDLSLSSWESLAGWCYEMGGKVSSPNWVKDAEPYGGQAALKIISSYHSDGVDVDRASSETLEDQIRDLGAHSPEQISAFISAWKSDNSRVYSFFRLAVHSYFKFLTISPYKENNCKFVAATLRLLRLMVKHSAELRDVVDAELVETPVHPWIPIVPQLLARLNHADPYIRKKVEELLVKIGLEAPHLIIFPAVVGSGAMPTTKLFPMMKTYENKKDIQANEDEEEEDDDDREDDDEMRDVNERAAMMENSFHSILDSLAVKYSEEIAQVKMFVCELQRITLLWDELWLGALLQHQGDINRRFSSLQSEIKATQGNGHLDQESKDCIIKEKYRLILKPILFIFEQLNEITSVAPETPRERLFQEQYTVSIQDIMTKLKEPADSSNPNDVWDLIQALQHSLQDKSRHRSGTNLSMSDISTTLSKLESTKIFMPGVRGRRSPPTIDKVENNVAILPTKTKPKKLIFKGSNGENYTYLFKGLEDLHLDERIMQFLSIANSMLKEPQLQAHHYSVVPLGPRSGLISWVENVTPIFSLYKKWQQREASKTTDDVCRTVMRPSELFASKLGPILMEHNIPNVDQNQRHKWPIAALRKCLQELMSATPSYLLYKELWAHSVNGAHWWRTLKTYSSSLAVMSMIGYIIGLGDRHLDNVLVNLKTGEVVHIDYNVCFEKGKTLRVPEKVPFRLTPNLMAALGVTGVEGVYKQTCEHVLQVMREGQETLLTLLEAFVYDPLIDWTPFSEGGYTGAVYGGGRELASDMKVNKKELMKEVACSMFKVRLTESKYNWMENKKALVVELEDLTSFIKLHMKWEKEKRKIQDLVKERHTQLALLKEAEGQPKHSLYTLHTRYSHYLQVHTMKESVCQKLQTKINECKSIDSQYHAVMQNLKGTDLANWIAEVRGRPKEDVCQVFDLIKEFLSNAGQSQTVQMCVYSEKTVGDLCLQQSALTLQLLEMLRDYYEICRHYPRSHLAAHRTQLYLIGSSRLLENMSPSCCDEVTSDFVKAIAVSEEEIMQVSMFSAGLERHLVDTSLRLQKCAERSAEMSRANVAQEVPSGWLAKGGHWGESVDPKNFNKDNKAVVAVVLSSLCSLNKKLIMIESQAMSAGDSLMDLTSQAGDWFLHDMCSVANLILRTAQLLPQSSNSTDDANSVQIGVALKCINHTYNQLKVLQEMYDNFMGIILIEAMQDQINEEPSVVRLVDRLTSLTSTLKVPISEMLKSLALHLRYTVMNMACGRQESNSSTAYPTQHGAVMPLVNNLRAAFDALLAPERPDEEFRGDMRVPDHGEMLLMGFNGLFNLEPSRNLMVQYFKQLVTPPTWSIVDQIKDPQKYYARSVMDDNVREILDATFFVKKLETFVAVLRMCRSNAHGFRGGPKAPQVPHDLDSLTKPMRKYIANYISSQILGIFSTSTAILICRLLEQQGINVTREVQQKDIGAPGQGNAPLEDLCRKLMDSRNPEWRVASGMVSQVESARKHEDALTRVRRDMSNLQVLTQHLKVTLTAHHWLHDHLLVKTNPHQLHIITRHSFLTEMRRAAQTMHGFQPRLKEAIEQQQNLITSAEQRLKWAAGANPALCEVMSAFEAAVASHKSKISKESVLAKNISGMASSILNYEALRTPTTEATHHDKAFIAVIEECRQFYELSTKKAINLSSAEQGLVALKAPKKKIDLDWLGKTEDLISSSLTQLKQEVEPINCELLDADQMIDQKIHLIKTTMAKHNQIIPDIKNLLKTLVKCDDSGLVGLDQYMSRYKRFVDTINSLIKNLTGNKTKKDAALMERALDDINVLVKSADSIYSELLGFSTNGASAVGTDSPKKSIPPQRDVGMVKNAYAIGVWRKVKFKLSGRDPDPGVKSTVKHQVNWTIDEATNLDNLALLYEGWTPWV